MGYVPYGYFIRIGKAAVDDIVAEQVRKLFHCYLSGLSIENAGKKAGLSLCHSSLGIVLADKRYLGDGFYPPIIEEEVFVQAQNERRRRLAVRGRAREHKRPALRYPHIRFHVLEISCPYNDPFRQAEYAYGLIQSEEVQDGR